MRKPALKNIRYVNAPIQPYANILEEQYQPYYKQIFRNFADPSAYPIIVHCWGGADRTGTVFYLLEALLGLEKKWLVMDYELTSLSIWGERIHTSFEFQEFLRTLARYAPPGSSLQTQVEGYLNTIGVSMAEIASIRAQLMEG